MANKKIPLRQRLATFIAPEIKSVIPALPPIDADYWGGLSAKHDYRTKPEQIQANVGWVFTANTAIVDPCAAVELKLYRKKPDGDREEILDHPILKLLDNPNSAHTGEQLRQLHYTYMNLVGEGYLLMLRGSQPFKPTKNQLPDALQLLPAHQVDFTLGKRFSESTMKFGQDTYNIENVIRDINPDPVSPYNGRSIITAAAATIDIDSEMKSWNRNLFANNARPGMLFTTKSELSDDAYQRTLKQLQDGYAGPENAYRPLLLEGGDAKPYMMSAQDLDFLSGREFTRDEILAMFRVPSAVLGSTTDFNRANMDAAFYIHTIINVVPRVRQFVKQLNVTLVQPYDDTLELDFESPVPEDKEAKLADAEAGLNKWWTIDEVRDMYGMEALPDGLGAQLYVPNTSTTLASVAAAPTDPPAPTQDPEDPDDDEDDDLTEDLEDDSDDEDDGNQKSHRGVKKKT